MIFAAADLIGDLRDLLRGFVFAVNHLGKAFAQRAVQIDLREAQVRNGRRLKSMKHFLASGLSRPEPFQQLNRFFRCHAGSMPGKFEISNF